MGAPFNWSTADTALAAAFGACQFPIRTAETEIVELRHSIKTRFFIGETCVHNRLDRESLLQAYATGELLKADPLHPFLQALRAAHNYAALLRMQKTGERLRLTQVPGSHPKAPPVKAWQYEPGEEDPRLRLNRGPRTTDLPLAAALAVISIPVIDIEGQPGSRFYVLPAYGLRSLALPHAFPEWRTAHLIRREVPGKPTLALEKTDPQHPLCTAYQGSYTYAVLIAHCKRLARNVLIKAPHSKRRAHIPENPTADLLADVRRHFKIPG